MQPAAFQRTLPRQARMLKQDQLKVFAERLDDRFFIHLFYDLVDLELSVRQKSKVKKSEAHFTGKYNPGAAVRHHLDHQQAAQVIAHHTHLCIVKRGSEARPELLHTPRIPPEDGQIFVRSAATGQHETTNA